MGTPEPPFGGSLLNTLLMGFALHHNDAPRPFDLVNKAAFFIESPDLFEIDLFVGWIRGCERLCSKTSAYSQSVLEMNDEPIRRALAKNLIPGLLDRVDESLGDRWPRCQLQIGKRPKDGRDEQDQDDGKRKPDEMPVIIIASEEQSDEP